MMRSFRSVSRVIFARVLSSAVLVLFTALSPAQAHEVLPSITDMTQDGGTLVFDMRLNVESFISGIDQTETTDTNDAPQATTYDELRALDPIALEDAFRNFWPKMAESIDVTTSAGRAPLTLTAVQIAPVDNIANPRTSVIQFTAALPDGAETVQVGWARAFGTLVIRQMGVDAPYDGFLEAGAVSDPIQLSGGDQAGQLQTFINYIPVGFDHIVPLGLDHILFVLGLFFLSTHFRPLLWQVSAFTIAHTITLALAGLGYVSIPGYIVEPLIAASIIYVAVENIFTDGLSPWRPFVVFGFGLLHGLGFASVLAQFGLPEHAFFPALIGFNIGVEFGQLAVISVAFLCVYKAMQFSRTGEVSRTFGAVYLLAMVCVMALLIPLSGTGAETYAALSPLLVIVAIILGFSAASSVVGRFDSYREVVSMPASVLIGVAATWWFIERVFL